MRYVFNGNDYNDLDELISDVIDELSDDTDSYDEMLDEVYGDVEVGSLSWSASRVLAEMDPTAYRCGISDWADNECDNIRYELERASDGDTVYTPVGDIEVHDDEYDDEYEDEEEEEGL